MRQNAEAEKKAAKAKYAAEVKAQRLLEKQAKKDELERKRAYHANKKAEREAKKARKSS